MCVRVVGVRSRAFMSTMSTAMALLEGRHVRVEEVNGWSTNGYKIRIRWTDGLRHQIFQCCVYINSSGTLAARCVSLGSLIRMSVR